MPYACQMGLRGRKANEQKHSIILGMFARGMTQEQVGQEFGISRQRVQQILSKYGIARFDGGQTIKRFLNSDEIIARQKAKIEKRNRNREKRWGFSSEEYEEVVRHFGNSTKRTSPFRRFAEQRRNSRERGIIWNMTFADWWRVWVESGKWSQRGRGRKFAMARYGDSGAYEVGNVYICTGAQNSSDQYLVRPHPWSAAGRLTAKSR
jgi:transcriptional regulator with XRE-family HTH domain